MSKIAPNSLIIGIDFDGTIVEHEYPNVGKPHPTVFFWLKKFQEEGAKLILWTMRSNDEKFGMKLDDAVEICKKNGIEFYGLNTNPTQFSWTRSNKAYAHVYIDDAAFGCPLLQIEGKRPIVDWDTVGPKVLQMIIDYRTKPKW